jgi:translation initiation factor IF-2
MRIHELAKELNIDSKELVKKLQALNFPVKSHMSAIDTETAEVIKHELSSQKEQEIDANVIEVDFPVTVKDLAVKLNKKSSELLADMMKAGKMFNINQGLDEKTAGEIARRYEVNLKAKPSAEQAVLRTETKELKKRCPIVTIMGHIDHGKTSLLDYIRKTTVAAKESGGITQHIGAYQVNHEKGSICFLDTPGHETFTAMRARGAHVTDIVILVVAADEGVKPQTIEAYDHAKAAKVPVIVAVNKIDKPNANVDMVKQELSKIGLTSEDWGGKTVTVGVSAKTGKGVDELLELILLQAELMELKADYGRAALGIVVEAKLSKGKGPMATVLIQNGKLNAGDWVVCGLASGRVRAMHDDRGNPIEQVLPGQPAEVVGLDNVPHPGDQIMGVPDEKAARQIIAQRRDEEDKKKILKPNAHFKLEDLYKKVQEENLKQLKVIVKADVGGTLEAVEGAMLKISSKEVELVITHKGVGTINSSDVLLAEVTDSLILGFKVPVDVPARDLAKKKGIEVRVYQIVYELLDDVKAALEGLLTPQIKRTFLGRARVKTVFKLSRSGVIAGSAVEKGKILRGAPCQVYRGTDIIHEGKVQTLKRFKDDVRDVAEGFECGISVGYNEIQAGDVIDVFHEETIARKLK